MKQILIILSLFASVTTFAQSPRIKLNQITKDTVKGSVLISSPSDSGMVYSRDFYIAYGADTVLILYGDTLASTSGIISSVLSDGVTITGDGTTGNELKVDTLLIATIKALNDSLATISASTTPDGVTITGDGSVGNPLKVDTATVISTIKGLVDSLSNYVTTNTSQTITSAKTFTSDLNVDAKIALNAGDNNIVIGDGAGANLVSGQALGNVLVGTQAGAAIDSGNYNVANGYQALYNNTTGYENIANGYRALYTNTSGINNVANGYRPLYNNTIGGNNVANGYEALYSNTSGNNNVANGAYALYSNASGNNNVANGNTALFSLSSGSNNQAYGLAAGRYIDGGTALTTANSSIFLGSNTKASANGNTNEIVIGTNAIGNGSNSVTIGASTNTKVVLNGVGSTGGTNSALYITSGGELTTNSSDERLKTNINQLDAELTTLMKLNPVTYNYTNNLGKITFGFIAQELEEYYPDLVFTNPISKYKGIHYHLFAPILTKAIQEQQAIIETQASEIDQLKTLITDLTNRLIILENK